MTVNRSDLIKIVARRAHVNQITAEEYVDLTLQTIADSLLCGENVVFKNFGRFQVRTREPVERRNPKTGEAVQVGRRRSILFRPAAKLKARMNEQ